MHKTKYGINPRIFYPKFREVDHQYPTRFSQNSFYYRTSGCKTISVAITLRGPTIWNSFLSHHEKPKKLSQDLHPFFTKFGTASQ